MSRTVQTECRELVLCRGAARSRIPLGCKDTKKIRNSIVFLEKCVTGSWHGMFLAPQNWKNSQDSCEVTSFRTLYRTLWGNRGTSHGARHGVPFHICSPYYQISWTSLIVKMCNFGSLNYRFVPTTHLHRCLVRCLVHYLVLNLDMTQGLFFILIPPAGGIAERRSQGTWHCVTFSKRKVNWGNKEPRLNKSLADTNGALVLDGAFFLKQSRTTYTSELSTT